eukprot:scaffold3577_cov414-Prasinococcus_capsulatus_cf.AAC.6
MRYAGFSVCAILSCAAITVLTSFFVFSRVHSNTGSRRSSANARSRFATRATPWATLSDGFGLTSEHCTTKRDALLPTFCTDPLELLRALDLTAEQAPCRLGTEVAVIASRRVAQADGSSVTSGPYVP